MCSSYKHRPAKIFTWRSFRRCSDVIQRFQTLFRRYSDVILRRYLVVIFTQHIPHKVSCKFLFLYCHCFVSAFVQTHSHLGKSASSGYRLTTGALPLPPAATACVAWPLLLDAVFILLAPCITKSHFGSWSSRPLWSRGEPCRTIRIESFPRSCAVRFLSMDLSLYRKGTCLPAPSEHVHHGRFNPVG
jgi:hypothetical protein